MSLSRLEAIYGWINNLDPNIKTIIIIILAVIVIDTSFKSHTKFILRDYTEQTQHDKQLAEEYTKIIAPALNEQVELILARDKEASNIILLNYHNTLTSTHGLSYRYLTALTEKTRGMDTKKCLRIWKELEYINYGEEIERINGNKSLRMDSIGAYARTLPNLVDLLQRSNAVSAAFYPITGINDPIGMIIVIYHAKKEYHLGYYQSTIAPSIQPLSTWLDYNSVKNKFKKLYESGQAEPERLLQ
jgi:hypothetical protein|nr:MAG TPA: hypothetical protein [Caudoviricetes sp.]